MTKAQILATLISILPCFLIALVAGSDFGQIFLTDTDQARQRRIVDGLTDDRAYFVARKGAFTRIE